MWHGDRSPFGQQLTPSGDRCLVKCQGGCEPPADDTSGDSRGFALADDRL